jgi:FlaG/FlaF family flagellin (archaellin)
VVIMALVVAVVAVVAARAVLVGRQSSVLFGLVEQVLHESTHQQTQETCNGQAVY